MARQGVYNKINTQKPISSAALTVLATACATQSSLLESMVASDPTTISFATDPNTNASLRLGSTPIGCMTVDSYAPNCLPQASIMNAWRERWPLSSTADITKKTRR